MATKTQPPNDTAATLDALKIQIDEMDPEQRAALLLEMIETMAPAEYCEIRALLEATLAALRPHQGKLQHLVGSVRSCIVSRLRETWPDEQTADPQRIERIRTALAK